MADMGTRFTTEGLAIKEMKVGESDRLVTLLTKEYGLIKAFASGAENIKSKKNSSTSLLTYASFTILNKKGTYRIYEAAPISRFFTLGADIEVLAISQYFCELGLVFAQNDEPNTELLRLLLNSLHFLTKEKRYPPLIKAITEFRTAVISGYMPDLVACKNCGEFENSIMFFDLEEGAINCKDCGGKGTPIDKTLLSALRHITYSEFQKLYSFEIPDASADRLSQITSEYILIQSGQKFTSLDFLNSFNF